jgi:hypothetical protein
MDDDDPLVWVVSGADDLGERNGRGSRMKRRRVLAGAATWLLAHADQVIE